MIRIKCMKCGKNLKDNEYKCSYCEYENNLNSGFIYEDTVMSKPGERKIIDYIQIFKKTFIIVIATSMVGISAAGGIFLLTAEDEVKASMGLMSSSAVTYKKEVKELLRGAKLGMSREEVMRIENSYEDSVKEFNDKDYLTYTGCTYGGYAGRTTYIFSSNNLKEISVVFYPEKEKDLAYEDLINTFTEEYGEGKKEENSEDASKSPVHWNNGKISIDLSKGKQIKLVVKSGK